MEFPAYVTCACTYVHTYTSSTVFQHSSAETKRNARECSSQRYRSHS